MRGAVIIGDFDYWFNSAQEYFDDYSNNLKLRRYSKAAFELHQVTERLYRAILLVFTRYKPSTHDLQKLCRRVASIEPQFLSAFPRGSEEEIKRFELLRERTEKLYGEKVDCF